MEGHEACQSFNLKMDNETALGLVKNGSTLLLLDVPQFTLIGIDTQVFSVGPIFKGIKMVPPGSHFLYYSSANRHASDFSPVIGFFIFTCQSEVIVRKWHQQEERLVKLSEDEEGRYCAAVRNLEFDHQLGPYALNNYLEWRQISNYITKDTIEKLEPIGGEITVTRESGLIDATSKTTMEKHLAKQLRDIKLSVPSDETCSQRCYYTTIPRVVKLKGISGEDLTSLNLDKTQLLETILMQNFGGVEDLLLGELQFAFVAFLMGQSLEAFLQWKALVSLLFSCIEAPFHMRTRLFTKFVKVIYFQIKHGFHKNHENSSSLGTSIFLDDAWLSEDNFLCLLCTEFFSLVQEAPIVDGTLLSWTKKLKELLKTTLGWKFEDAAVAGIYREDEFAPVVEVCDETSVGEDMELVQ